MHGTPIDSTLSATLTPPPRSNRTFQRPPKTDSTLLNESLTQTPSPLQTPLRSPSLTPPPGMRLSPGRPILTPTRPTEVASPSIHETQPALSSSVEQTLPTPTLRVRPKPSGVDLKSIREHLGSTSFTAVDAYTGEKRVPLTWVAVILAATAFGAIWLSNHLVP
jgi:hypothetical protein